MILLICGILRNDTHELIYKTEILTDIENTLIVSGIGDNSCQAGKYIRFKDSETGITGIYEITEDSHTINSSVHRMTLRLKFKKVA